MMSRLSSKSLNENKFTHSGFTIIEVVIVLAIAGLIFAVVFIAVPQLQAAQRDSAREDAMGRLEAAITQYQSRNGGQIPGRGQINNNVVPDYMDEFADPIGGNYTALGGGPGNASYEDGTISYHKGRVCVEGDNSTEPHGNRTYSIRYELEQGGIQCRDNL